MAALVISMAGIVAAGSENVAASAKKYVNGYKGVFTGASSLQDVCKELGAPIRMEETKNGHNYRFKGAIVNFSGRDREKVNTVIIDNDYEYTDPNGFKLGDKVEDVMNKVEVRSGSSTMSDKKHGIVYWHNGKVIKRIVLTRSMVE